MKPIDPTEQGLLVVKLKLVALNAGMAATAGAQNDPSLEEYLLKLEEALEVVRRIVPKPFQLSR